MRHELTLEDVINADNSLKDIIGGCIVNTCTSSKKVSKCSYKELYNIFNNRGWKILKQVDVENPDYNSYKKRVLNAIELALSKKNTTNVNTALLDVSSDDLFKI